MIAWISIVGVKSELFSFASGDFFIARVLNRCFVCRNESPTGMVRASELASAVSCSFCLRASKNMPKQTWVRSGDSNKLFS